MYSIECQNPTRGQGGFSWKSCLSFSPVIHFVFVAKTFCFKFSEEMSNFSGKFEKKFCFAVPKYNFLVQKFQGIYFLLAVQQ